MGGPQRPGMPNLPHHARRKGLCLSPRVAEGIGPVRPDGKEGGGGYPDKRSTGSARVMRDPIRGGAKPFSANTWIWNNKVWKPAQGCDRARRPVTGAGRCVHQSVDEGLRQGCQRQPYPPGCRQTRRDRVGRGDIRRPGGRRATKGPHGRSRGGIGNHRSRAEASLLAARFPDPLRHPHPALRSGDAQDAVPVALGAGSADRAAPRAAPVFWPVSQRPKRPWQVGQAEVAQLQRGPDAETARIRARLKPKSRPGIRPQDWRIGR